MSCEIESEDKTADCQNTDEELNEESENSNTYILNASCVEVKLEIELNEGESEHNEGDPEGRLQFVNFNHHGSAEIIPPHYGNPAGLSVWNPSSLPATETKNTAYVSRNAQDAMQPYEHSFCDTPSGTFSNDKSTDSELQTSSSTSTVSYEFAIDNSAMDPATCSSQYADTIIIPKKRRWKPTDAEKKRNYRNRIKVENPDLWSSIKLKERCKKKEQREERRLILFEMQKTQALISECPPSDVDNHKAHMQTLRERHPDVWVQFVHEMSPIKNNFSNNPNDSDSHKISWPSLTEAEKKRYYRRKMKEENPEMWTAVKMKDACKKREQREEKRHILLEMQKTQELISHCDSSDLADHKAHLDGLKERYPDLWMQLKDAIAATQMRSQMMLLDKNNKRRRMTKPVEMYKDVVEAHKKFVYRQRLKQERPEYYAQMKARDAYAKSLRRMMLKRGICATNGQFDFSAIAAASSGFGISVGNSEYIISTASDGFYTSSKSNEYNISVGSQEYYTSTKRDGYYINSKSDGYNITAEKDVYNVSAGNNRLDING